MRTKRGHKNFGKRWDIEVGYIGGTFYRESVSVKVKEIFSDVVQNFGRESCTNYAQTAA